MPMATVIAQRVNFFDKQFLRVDEFRDEQLYQLEARRRHNVGQHSWGIVAGLEITQEEGALVVRPGMAIDGYGRELLLADKKRLSPETFDDLGTERLDAWLIYGRRDGASAPDGYGSCGQNDVREAYRSQETPQLLLEKPLSNIVDARKPSGVPVELFEEKVPLVSDNPNDMWRVYLGRITRLAPDQFTIDISQRPYAGLVGEVVDHPANAARVEIGNQSRADSERTVGNVTYVYKQDSTAQPGQAGRFAVFIPEESEADLAQQQKVNLSPRFEIRQDGLMRLRGRTVINGNLRLTGGAVQFVNPATFDADHAPEEPSIYRIQDGATDQLRIDLGSDNPANREFVIGFSTPDGKFTQCLKVELKDTTGSGKLAPLVTIYGDLKVDGKLSGKLIKRTVSQEAQNAILGSFQSGIAAGNPGS
jgi:hypothetical protein